MFCQKCGKLIPEGKGTVLEGHLLCEDCAADAVKCYCQRCGKEIPRDTLPQESGKLLCEDCAKLPDDSAHDDAFSQPDKPPRPITNLPIWSAALLLLLAAIAIAVLFGTRTLCWHRWQPATCQTPEICEKCGRLHGAPLPHKWKDATCTEPRICMLCGETEGEPAGHIWLDATCSEPRTCEVCGETEGEAPGHTWVAANCQHPMMCSVCGEEKGEIGTHRFLKATCTEPRTCEFCGATEGNALGHSWRDANCTEPQTCEVCGETQGKALGHKWKAATVLRPKTCEICGETEGEALDIRSMDALALMDVIKADFIDAVEDAHHEAIGCDECSSNNGTLMSDLFPGYILAYTDGADEEPNHIHVFEGTVTGSTSIGMTYQELTDALGEPTWAINEKEWSISAVYTLDGHTVEYVFNDRKLIQSIITYQMRLSKKLKISDPSIRVVAAKLS